MTLFERLLVAHLVADWLLQTEWQALNKDRDFRALFSHIGVYSLVMLGVLVAQFGFRNGVVYLVVGMIALTHGFIDRRKPVIWFMKTFRLIVKRPSNPVLVLAVDQTFHILVLAIAVLILSG
jgi:hypothetical protein